MTTFLRLFPQFRYLEEAAADKMRLQDKNNALESRVTELIEELRESREKERFAYQAMVNIKCGQAVFPTAPHLKDSDDDLKPIQSRYVQGADLARAGSREALRKYYSS